MAKAYLLLGGNLNDRYFYITSALELIRSLAGTIIEKSSFYETAPWGFKAENFFLNQVVAVETILEPADLFQAIVEIENRLGRTRNGIQFSSRTIDIDILFYEDRVILTESLSIPHPKIKERRFVLKPMCEINPSFIHPIEKKTLKELLNSCTDNLEVIRLEKTLSYLSPKAKSPASPNPGTI
jgi:2-amino-4-hydroxy-6-hydroxymethyldihydropteridine diphosphokinase